MTDKKLLSQLNKLKNIKPSSDWKKSNREILFNQISRGHSSDEVRKLDIFKNILPHNMFSRAFQPVFAAVLIVLVVVGGGIASLNASRGTKPGDSLYIAKIISEKAQLAVAFNHKEKAKLGVEFASNRAREISEIIAESDKDREKKIEKLTENFKKEISAVKVRLEKIDMAKNDIVKESNKAEEAQDEDTQIFSANLEKTDQGMEIYDPADNSADSTTADEPADNIADNAESDASSTEEAAIEETPATDSSNATDILAEAEKLFNEQDYDGTVDKLAEVNNIIDNADSVDETADEIADETVAEEAGEDTASTTDEADGTIIN